MIELISLPYSPWSEKARWALDARHVPHRVRTFQPLIGELELRVLLRRPVGAVTVPVLRTPEGVLSDSFAIARYAERHGQGASLFPVGADSALGRYNELSERGLRAGRALALERMLADDAALAAMVPRPLAARLGPLAAKLGAFGIRRTLRKYGAKQTSNAEHERVLCEILDVLRADLSARKGTVPTLLGTFSYADITMAQVLAFVEPPAIGLRVGKANRRAFTHTELALRFRDVLNWRDTLYAQHRLFDATSDSGSQLEQSRTA